MQRIVNRLETPKGLLIKKALRQPKIGSLACKCDMKTAILNIGQIISGNWQHPITSGSTILLEGERILKVGEVKGPEIEDSDVIIDAGGSVNII